MLLRPDIGTGIKYLHLDTTWAHDKKASQHAYTHAHLLTLTHTVRATGRLTDQGFGIRSRVCMRATQVPSYRLLPVVRSIS